MFSMLPAHDHPYGQSYHYSPHHPSPLSSSPLRNPPSPLSPRNTNVPSRAQDIIMSSPTKGASFPPQSDLIFTYPSTTPDTSSKKVLPSPPPSRRESVYSRRATKPNPLMSGRGNGDEGRETRRKLFLKKVREGSEEKRWADRGGDEEIMRCLWVAEERRRAERQKREAMGIEGPPEEDEKDQMMGLDEAMADEVAISEEQELEALLRSIDAEDQYPSHNPAPSNDLTMFFGDMGTSNHIPVPEPYNQQSPDTPYGSDDDEYDHIFMDVIQQESRMSSQQPAGYVEDREMMDMS